MLQVYTIWMPTIVAVYLLFFPNLLVCSQYFKVITYLSFIIV